MLSVTNQQKGAGGARVRCATRSRRGFAPPSAPAALQPARLSTWECARSVRPARSGGHLGSTCASLGSSTYYCKDFREASPPPSGGPVHTTLSNGFGRKAESVRHGIRRTRPTNRSHSTRTEIARRIVSCRSSSPCTRQTAAVPFGDEPCQATAGAMGIKGASAHLRCGSMVLDLGVAAPRVPVGKAAFGRPSRPGTVLAHLDVGLSSDARQS
jgi:hypothetical protein